MTDLIACLSTGKGTWRPVIQLSEMDEWNNVFLVAPEFAKERYTPKQPVDFVDIDTGDSLIEMVASIKEQLGDKIEGTQVALNLYSGSGKEHMAVVSAVLQLGLGIRLVSSKEGELEVI